ncbi:MAG TPA: hypothetical protein VFM16_07180 [Holophagaceae bacterium]|nr:hypothetical protein [Holophagaceae bacterium]
MRALIAPLALAASLALPLSAQSATRYVKVDIVSHDGHGRHKGDGPTEVHMRAPLSLATSILECAQDSEIRINGKESKPMKADQLVKMLQESKPGDLLLEVNTSEGDHIKVTIE